VGLLSVPKRFQRGLKELLKLTDEQKASLLTAVHTLEPVADRHALLQLLTASVSIDREALDEITSFLVSLAAFQRSHQMPVEAIAADLSLWVKSSEEFTTVEEDEKEGLKDLLTKLLCEKGVLVLAVKAREVIGDEAITYLSSRILSDIRPVFGDEVGEQALGAGIVHRMKLVYWENFVQKEFFVSLSDEDLDELSDVIDRAREKAVVMRGMLTKLDLHEFQFDEDQSK
jgi:hypothetical protein